MSVGKQSILRAVNSKSNDSKIIKTDRKINILEINLKDITCEKAVNENKDLTNSIKKNGLIKPLIALNVNGKLILIDGKKRLVSLKSLNKTTAYVVLIDIDQQNDFDIIFKEVEKFNKLKVNSKEDNIHENKFKVIEGISTKLPEYLL